MVVVPAVVTAVAVTVAATSMTMPVSVAVMMVALPLPLRPVDVGSPGELDEDSLVAFWLVHAQQHIS